ncbi:MAG: hypothetical protein LBB43_00585 [Spirochaetaceae bacterium]|jgi:hypothetical protein|nr:hypothetical protein [Spirochaetaceae bacterium]
MFVLVVLSLITVPAFTQETGDSAIAARYVQWAQAALQENQYERAGLALERALDFADTSSDISYLYALVLSYQDKPQGAILNALRQALETGRWVQYNPAQARLLETQVLIRLRLFSQALQSLQALPLNADTSYLRLLILKNTNTQEFKAFLLEALERYPRDGRFVRLFLDYASFQAPELADADILSEIIMKIPFLLNSDPALAYLVTPFIKDGDTARHFVTSHRQGSKADPAWFPIMLNLGLVDDTYIIQELAGQTSIDRTLLEDIWNLLRNDEARSIMRERFAGFSGTISEDTDKDGYINFSTVYNNGRITSLSDDFNQDGLADQVIFFEDGIPHYAELILVPELSDAGGTASSLFALPIKDAERQKAIVQWEKYPALLDAEAADTYYFLRPFDLFFTPVYIQENAVAGLPYPQRSVPLRLSIHALAASSMTIERKSAEFDGALERIELEHGIPRLAREYAGAAIVSETTFDHGKAQSQKLDLDGDGYFETIRYFGYISEGPVSKTVIESFVTDWDGNGIFEGGEFWKTR